MVDVIRCFPENWASDNVTSYIDSAISNIVATTQADNPAYPTISEIDGIFKILVQNLINTDSILEAVLLMRAHSAFLASSMLAMGGQATESFMVFRSVIENALYALHIFKDEAAGDIWLNRHRDEEALVNSRNYFSYRKVSQTLQVENQAIADVSEMLYRRTIDFGAHPNERASSSAIQIIEEEGKKTIKQNYIAGGSDSQIHALKTGAQIGVCTLEIFRIIFRHRFDILGLTEKVDALKQNL